MIFCIIFGIGFRIDLYWLWGWFLVDLWLIFGGFVCYFRDSAKNTAPRELTANTNQIEGRAHVKASKETVRNKEKQGKKTNKQKS